MIARAPTGPVHLHRHDQYGPAEISSVATSGGITLSIRSNKTSVLLASRTICQRQPSPYSKPTLITPLSSRLPSQTLASGCWCQEVGPQRHNRVVTAGDAEGQQPVLSAVSGWVQV